MTQNQNLVKEFIQTDRTLRGAIEIYNKLPNKNLAFLASLNRMRGTEENCLKAAYQLCKAVGIEERMLTILWNQPITPKTETKTKIKKIAVIGAASLGSAAAALTGKKTLMDPLSDRVMSFDPAEAAWRDIQKLAADISDETKKDPSGGKKVDLLPFIAAHRAELIKKIAAETPIQVKQSVKLREQFPFLEFKSCPMELKALVNDLITAYHRYKDGHEKLFESMTLEEERSLAADVVKNFIENKEIFEELEHYKETGEILGKHQIFEQKRIKEELSELSAEELNKKEGALRTNISRNKKKAEAEKDPEKKIKYESAVEDYIWQHDHVLYLIKKL